MKKILLASIAAATLTLGSARADVITFDDPAGNAAVDKNFSSFSDNGLTFTNSNGYSYIWDSSSPNSNGTNNLIFAGNSGHMAIKATGGKTFILNSINLAISWFDSNAQETLTVNGKPLTITNMLTTYNLNLVDVTEVDISGLPNNKKGSFTYWTADNVVFNTVASNPASAIPEPASAIPEPASMTLLGAGVFGLGLIRRRRA